MSAASGDVSDDEEAVLGIVLGKTAPKPVRAQSIVRTRSTRGRGGARGGGGGSARGGAGDDDGWAADDRGRLHLHLLFGPRVDRRTVEKVVGSLGGAMGLELEVKERQDRSGKRGGVKGGWGEAHEEGLTLLEVRSAVRAEQVCDSLLFRYIPFHTTYRVSSLVLFDPLSFLYACSTDAAPFPSSTK
jgi:hypothetical protein